MTRSASVGILLVVVGLLISSFALMLLGVYVEGLEFGVMESGGSVHAGTTLILLFTPMLGIIMMGIGAFLLYRASSILRSPRE